jgi:hypothetical protein
MLTAGIVADLLGKDPVTAAEVARNAAENNFLTAPQLAAADKAAEDCGTDELCRRRVKDAANTLSAAQDTELSTAKVPCWFSFCDQRDKIMAEVAKANDPLLLVQYVASLHPEASWEDVTERSIAYLTEADSSVDASFLRTLFGTLDASVVLGTAASVAKVGVRAASPVILDIFGGRVSQIPGAISVDIIAEGSSAIRASATQLPIKSGIADQIIVSNPYIKGLPVAERTIMQWLPEATRVLKPGEKIIINGTIDNSFTKLPDARTLESLGLRVVQERVPLLPQFQGQVFHFTNGKPIFNGNMRSTILEKVP